MHPKTIVINVQVGSEWAAQSKIHVRGPARAAIMQSGLGRACQPISIIHPNPVVIDWLAIIHRLEPEEAQRTGQLTSHGASRWSVELVPAPRVI